MKEFATPAYDVHALSNSHENHVASDNINLNRTSLHSMESSWIEVPVACKARAFNASPISLKGNKISDGVRNIYAAFGA